MEQEQIFIPMAVNKYMGKVIKISNSTTLKLTELMNSLKEVGCSSEEKLKARKIFEIYLDGKADINEENPIIRREKKKITEKLKK